MNAKKIENRIHANIISEKNDDALKEIIQDYEKRILQMEAQSNADKTRSSSLMKIIEQLQLQKEILAKRLVFASAPANQKNFIEQLKTKKIV